MAEQTRKHAKGTRKELEERISITADMLSRGFRDGQIKKRVAAFYGCSPRSVERYLRRAREMLCDELAGVDGGGRDIHRAQSLDFYRSVMRADETNHQLKMKAQERIDKILGLEQPVMVHQEVNATINLVDMLNNDRVRELRNSLN